MGYLGCAMGMGGGGAEQRAKSREGGGRKRGPQYRFHVSEMILSFYNYCHKRLETLDLADCDYMAVGSW